MRKSIVIIGVCLGIALMLTMSLVPVSAAAGGTVSYFTVSGGKCTSTVFPNVASDGNVPGMLPNNVGGPPITAVVGTGSICIEVTLTGVTSGTFMVTSNKLSGSLTLNSANSFSAEGVFTSSYSGTCTTVPIVISPSGTVGSTSGQINHVFVGTGCATGVPEFAAPLGVLLVVGICVPLLLVARKFKPAIRMP